MVALLVYAILRLRAMEADFQARYPHEAGKVHA
jgi:hypothetical protein